MAKETVGALYTKLGLDLSELDRDFALADKTVNQAMARLTHEGKTIRIKTDVDLKSLHGAGNDVLAVTIQEQSLTRQLEVQRKKVKLAAAAYREMVAAKGADSAASAKLETRLLNERRAYATLENQLRSLRDSQKKTGVIGRITDSIANGASATAVMKQGAMDLGASALIASPIGRTAGAALAIGGGAVAMAKQAMEAGNNIYLLAQKMHTTTGEAAKMNIAFKLAGADVNAAVPAIVRLDKAVENAGTAGNQTTRILSAFGVNLRDASGNLLPVNQQLVALAKGYQNAAAAGLESEYVAQVLGSRGAELVPVLSQMADIQQRMATMPTTGLLDPETAHEMAMNWHETQVEIGQVTGALGAALMPIVNDALPPVIDWIEEITQAIHDNKNDIKDLAGGLSETGGIVKDIIKEFNGDIPGVDDGLKGVVDLVKQVNQALKEVKNTMDTIKPVTDILPTPPHLFKWGKEIYDWATGQQEEPKEKPADEAPKEKEPEQATQSPEVTRQLYQALATPAGASTGVGTTAKVPDISDDIYRATHSDLQNQIHDIDLRVEKLRAEGVEESEIVRLSEAEKAKVYRDFNDSTIAQINRSWKSELQNRLDEIDREKRAWIQKGVDEVTATRWAENEKGKVRQQAGLSAIREQKKYLDIYRNAMAGPGTLQERQNNARVAMLEAMRKQYGIQNEHITPQELAGFTDQLNHVKNNLVPGLETENWAIEPARNAIPVIRGSSESRDIPGITTTINVSGGVFTDNDTINRMTDVVSDRVNNTITKVINNSNLSYASGG